MLNASEGIFQVIPFTQESRGSNFYEPGHTLILAAWLVDQPGRLLKEIMGRVQPALVNLRPGQDSIASNRVINGSGVIT